MVSFRHVLSRTVALAALVLLAVSSSASAATRNVPGTYPTIQAGVDAANPGDVVLVADGIYNGAGNRDINPGGKNITIKSSGGPANCIIDCGGSEGTPHRGFYYINGESSASLLEGFTIRNGWAPMHTVNLDGDIFDVSVGGAVACDGSSPTMQNLVLQNNTAWYGGAIVCALGSNSTITNCQFLNNTAFVFTPEDGADGTAGGILTFDSFVTVRLCLFSGNTSNNGGGAIEVSSELIQSSMQVDSCIFIQNSAVDGGGAITTWRSAIQLTNSMFHSNSTGTIGGAIYFDSGVGNSSITNCTFANNSSTGIDFSYGSVFYAEGGGSVDFSNCLLTGNTGGYVTIACSDDTPISITCTNIWGNTPGDWVDCITGWEIGNNNLSADPMYCLEILFDVHIDTNSPCAPTNSPCGQLIGSATTACTNVTPSCCAVAGDANSDSKISIGDVTYSISRLFTGGGPSICCEEADSDGSGTFNIGDVTRTIGFIFSGGTAPVCGPVGVTCNTP